MDIPVQDAFHWYMCTKVRVNDFSLVIFTVIHGDNRLISFIIFCQSSYVGPPRASTAPGHTDLSRPLALIINCNWELFSQYLVVRTYYAYAILTLLTVVVYKL